MVERKSNRARKSVDYTKFAPDDESDDDFKEATPPVAKRQKLSSNKENSTKHKKESKEPKPKQPRQTVEEKIYERELQKALELSLSQSDGSQETTVTKETENTDIPILIEEENTDNGSKSPVLPKIDPPVLTKMAEADEIQVLETDINVEEENAKSSSRRRAASKKRYVDSDSDGNEPDFEVDLRKFLRSPVRKGCKQSDDSDFEVDKEEESDISDESDEDFNMEDSDSDFGGSKKKKGKKDAQKIPKSTSTPKRGKTSKTEKKPTQSTKAVAKPSVKSTSASKPVVTKTVSATSGLTKSSLHKSPVTSGLTSSSTVNKTPSAGLPARKHSNWTPPASTSTSKSPASSVSLKSPSTGLRIGLSRNMRLKPLHPNLKINN